MSHRHRQHRGRQARRVPSVTEGATSPGWYAATEPDMYYDANLVLVAAELQE